MAKQMLQVVVLAVILLTAVGCRERPTQIVQAAAPSSPGTAPREAVPSAATDAASAAPTTPAGTPVAPPLAVAAVHFTLETVKADGRMIFVGVGGDIDGLVNPDLVVTAGADVQLTLLNSDGIPHDLSVPDFFAKSRIVSRKGRTAEVSFVVGADSAGTYAYFCTVPGHRKAGQEGRLVVEAGQ
jgi:nitrite reductase (NO-forming)